MYCVRTINKNYTWIGGNDHRLAMFEGIYETPKGMSYNSYVLMDDKTVLFDTVDEAVSTVFFENLTYVLGERTLDYVIIHHMEPDHSALLKRILEKYPQVKFVCNDKSATYLKQFFHIDFSEHIEMVTEGSTLNTGTHELKFLMAPMIHWPEVMVTYDSTDKMLFSADAFGSFGTIDGAIYADEVNSMSEYIGETRRYYCNIVGKYGTQVQRLLEKLKGLEIEMICPLHGVIWRQQLNDILELYRKWSYFEAEEKGVLITFASVYGDTKNVAEIIACRLRDRGIKTELIDVSVTPASYIVASAFRWSHLLFASTTYSSKIFLKMDHLLQDLAAHSLQNKTVALIENGTWAPTAGKLMKELLEKCKNITFIEKTISIKSSIRMDQETEIEELVEAIAQSVAPNEEKVDKVAKVDNLDKDAEVVDPKAMIKLPYGLYLLSTKDGDTDNGCIINTAVQVTVTPTKMSIAVNKQNKTHDMILKSGVFSLSVLTENTPFSLIQKFGFHSGSEMNKFENFEYGKRDILGVLHLTRYCNSYMSGKVIDTYDYDTHTIFVAEIVEAACLSDDNSLTYSFYFDHIKPKVRPEAEHKKGFICKICGYIYEGDTLPEDFICPICKHGASDFEPLQ